MESGVHISSRKLNELGRVKQKQGDLAAALAYFQLACETDPEFVDCAISRVRILMQMGDVQLAARYSEKLVSLQDDPVTRALFELVTTLHNTQNTPENINIGGGPFYNHINWLNLESVPSPSNPNPIRLSPETVFPAADRSARIVYSSHCLEHLDDSSVDRCLQETRRVISREGFVVIKLPDFDRILKAWRNSESEFFSDETWNYGAVTPTWGNKGVLDTIDSRAAMIFCGYWNKAYGDHFSNNQNYGTESFHGPPKCSADYFENLKTFSSARSIAKSLRDKTLEIENEPVFNHQNAWLRNELCAVLETHGFNVLSTDLDRIIAGFSDIPGINEMRDISSYYLACLKEG